MQTGEKLSVLVPRHLSRKALQMMSDKELVEHLAVLTLHHGHWIHIWPRTSLLKNLKIDKNYFDSQFLRDFCLAC